MVSVITKDALKNKFYISDRWRLKNAQKFARETKKGGVYVKILTPNQAKAIKTSITIKPLTIRKINSIKKRIK